MKLNKIADRLVGMFEGDNMALSIRPSKIVVMFADGDNLTCAAWGGKAEYRLNNAQISATALERMWDLKRGAIPRKASK